MSSTRPPRRASASTVRAADRLAFDHAQLARTLAFRIGWARRWDPHQSSAPRHQWAAIESGIKGGTW